MDDTILEDIESFYVSLSTSDPAIVVQSGTSTVWINDNDSTFEEYCRSLLIYSGLRLCSMLLFSIYKSMNPYICMQLH